jgi:phosphatidylserine/phosphatidylglycerophosphate/cardiolipin synthase-like enzyme
MRVRKTNQDLTLRTIAGSHVVLLAMDMKEADCPGLLGFAIHRTDQTEEEAYWMEGTKTFEETDPGFPAGAKYATNKHPIQGFTWSDFTAKPGHKYTYRVQALTGSPTNLKKSREVSVDVETEDEASGSHDIFFNRGAAASQEYSRRFGKMAALENAKESDPRWGWLSRGAMEAILAFVDRAQGPGHALRVAAYEFRLPAFAKALKAAKDRGVDVKVLYDGNDNPPDKNGKVFPRDDNRDTATAAKVKSCSKERMTRDEVKNPPISHHKFILHLKGDEATAVLTGSTNFSAGGVFGQSNVVHIVDSKPAAAKYLQCWNLIAGNPDHAYLKTQLDSLNDIPTDLPRTGTNCLFSPQGSLDALDWYGKLAKESKGALMMTFAFGMHDIFKDAYRNGSAGLRYALMEKLLGPGIRKEKKAAAEAEMLAIRKKVANRLAIGNTIRTNAFDRWLSEKLTGLNTHVQYIHTKFMLVDPLGDDPIVITGSANFSGASTTSNDENMLIIRGNERVADIYVGEFMRLWNHYAFREWLAAGAPGGTAEFRHLDVQDRWWKDYFGDTTRSRQRAYFAG